MSINPFKEFFRRKKAEVKFSMAGPGRKLTSDPQPSSSSSISPRAQAAEAAMKRCTQDNSQRPAAQRMKTSQSASSSSVQGTGSTAMVSEASTETRSPVNQPELNVETGQLDRKVQLYSLEELAKRIKTPDIDDDFFRLTVEDAQLIKKRYEEAKKQDECLKTSEMRRREAEAKKSLSPVTRIRFKLPNGLVLEASFKSSENLHAIRQWLRQSCLELAELELQEFDLLLGHKPLREKDFYMSVYDAGLTPASTLSVVHKSSIINR